MCLRAKQRRRVKNAVGMKMPSKPFEKMRLGMGLGICIQVVDLPCLDPQPGIVNGQQVRCCSPQDEVRTWVILVEKIMGEKIHVRASLLPITIEAAKLGKNNARAAPRQKPFWNRFTMNMNRLMRAWRALSSELLHFANPRLPRDNESPLLFDGNNFGNARGLAYFGML